MRDYSPLRYPGGKTKLYDTVKSILSCNGLLGGTYVEPFAGGAGLAIKLLLNNDVSRIILNDIDPAIYYFWKTVLTQPDSFCNAIDNAELSIQEWQKQREIYKRGLCGNEFEFALSVFYLNRTNVSGILSGGVIGGIDQKGNYKIDARFNKDTLKQRIRCIAKRRKSIILYNLDAVELIEGNYLKGFHKLFINFDPPYVNKGAQLYKNSLRKEDHYDLFYCIKKCKKKWIVTYDTSDYIKGLYNQYHRGLLTLSYSTGKITKATEYIFFNKGLIIPERLLNGGKTMQCTDECRFCSIQKGKKGFGLIDTPILENEEFFLLSSIGALIEGWSLVVSKQHTYSMKNYYSNPSFLSFVNSCIRIVKKAYGVKRVAVFEHGANKFGSLTACGTNHSHIHIVPIGESLLDEFKEKVTVIQARTDQVSAIVKDSEYLLYSDSDDRFEDSDCYIHLLTKPMSQFFRQLIASKMGCLDKYNYKDNPNLETSSATVITLLKEIENEQRS